MNYSNPQIVFQEVPNEISLAISISGCDLACNGCHSAFTWDENYGKSLSLENIDILLKNYEGLISCFLFYGGEWNIKKLLPLIKYIKNKNLKICLYTGREISEINIELIELLDYLKTGRYLKNLGGLQNKKTNQKFYKINNGIILEELNYLFWK